MIDTGVIHGRFQILHNDHLRYLLAGKARCRNLVVGITNPDPTLTLEDSSDPQRHLPRVNPLTYYERYLMVRAVLAEAGVSDPDLSVVPFPINFPERYESYVPLDATFFLTIYDEWGRRKKQMFESIGLKVEVLWQRSPEQKGLSGEEIREYMAMGESWEHLVPPAVRGLMHAWDIPTRLRKLRHP